MTSRPSPDFTETGNTAGIGVGSAAFGLGRLPLAGAGVAESVALVPLTAGAGDAAGAAGCGWAGTEDGADWGTTAGCAGAADAGGWG